LTTLKIEDLDEKGRTPGGFKNDCYNPIWKLQITDDKNAVKYEGKFLDRNADANKADGFRP
jgi:hypothetical protein